MFGSEGRGRARNKATDPKIWALGVVTLVSTAALASAQVTDGRYQQGGCTQGLSEGVVEVESEVLRYWEGTCTLTEPVPISETRGTSYVGLCSGEGQVWQVNMVIIQVNDGQIMRVISDGRVHDYVRCPAD